MTAYNLKMTGTIDNIARMLADLLEKQETGFNLNYKMDIKDLKWFTVNEDDSRVLGEFEFDRELERKDLRVFEDTYKVKVGFND